jgi:alkylation response protein AidB-like acyl-CoA dehydrogenase
MQLELSETQAMVARTAREFAERSLKPIASELDRTERFPKDILKSLADIGLMGVNIPAYALAMIEIARGCASTSVTMAVTNMVGEVISAFGSPAQRQKHVPQLTSGAYHAGSFALSEPEAGSDPGSMRTVATRVDGGWRLRGQKMWITSGAHAGVFVVWARTGEPGSGTAGISCFLMEGGAEGLRIGKAEEKMGLRASNTVALDLDDVFVADDALLGEPNGGFRIAMMALDGGRIGIAAQAIGIASAAVEEAVAFARERKTFGKPIAEHQAIQFMIADCRTELEAARLLALRAAWLKESGRPFSQEAAMAKLYATEAANRICGRCFQVHGGYGYVKEFPIERHLRDVRVTTIYEGTSEIQRIVIARGALR